MLGASGIIVLMAYGKTQLKLVHKELLIVSIPLLFGFAFILMFESQMQTFRAVRNEAVQTVRVSNQIYRVTGQLYVLEDSLLKSPVSKSEQLTDRVDSDITALLRFVANRAYTHHFHLFFGS